MNMKSWMVRGAPEALNTWYSGKKEVTKHFFNMHSSKFSRMTTGEESFPPEGDDDFRQERRGLREDSPRRNSQIVEEAGGYDLDMPRGTSGASCGGEPGCRRPCAECRGNLLKHKKKSGIPSRVRLGPMGAHTFL
ncbi:uncharacterized protein LOC143039876 isoform X2 [Oratosquilla oratoria]|uniref:uncharacterized protein LOC143039876 isoform X2 n=1 Tax=Oratosquilla oratoria TaxID=337810 RepID=UPI003F7582D8